MLLTMQAPYDWTQLAPFTSTPPDHSGPSAVIVDLLGGKGPGDVPGLIGSTYLEGSEEEQVFATALDAAGNVYICGATKSEDLKVSDNAAQKALNLGLSDLYDGFISLVSSDCTQLLACTYLGGEGWDVVTDIKVSPLDGDIYVAGLTDSSELLNTSAAYDTTYNGGGRDVFLARLSADLSSKKYCTYFGGTGFDTVASIDLGDDGSVFLTAQTDSVDLPITPNAYCQTAPSGGTGLDIVAVRFNASLMSLDYCTYLGGSDDDYSPHCTLGPTGNLTVAYTSYSNDVKTTPDAHDNTLNGTNDTVVHILTHDGRGLVASTYLGGDSTDILAGLAVDSRGWVYVTGATESSDFETTADAENRYRMDTTYTDAFLTVLSPDLKGLEYSTLVGGEFYDLSLDVDLGPLEERVYTIGITSSVTDLNCTKGCFQDRYERGWTDLYIFSVNLTNRSLDYTSYFGGSGREQSTMPAHTLEVNGDGHILFGLDTLSDDIPIRTGAYCSTFAGFKENAVVVHINPTPCDKLDEPDVTLVDGDRFVNLSWDLSWYEASRINDVRIGRGMSPDTPDNPDWVRLGANDSKNDTWVQNGETYYYWVSVLTPAGWGAPTKKVGKPIGHPVAPTELEGGSGDGHVTLTWNTSADWGGSTVLWYHIFRGTASGETVDINVTLEGLATEWTDASTLEIGDTYYYAIMARNEEYQSEKAETAVLVFEPPSAPIGLDGTAGDGNNTVIWEEPRENGGRPIEGYDLQFRMLGQDWQDLPSLPAENLSYHHEDLDNGVVHSYRVAANNNVTGNFSTVLELSPYGVPTSPRDLNANCSVGTITLFWEEPENDNGSTVTYYEIRYGPARNNITGTDISFDKSWSTTEVVAGVNYTYLVRAWNDRGPGPYIETWKTVHGIPSVPLNLTATNQSFSILIGWDPPVDWGGAKAIDYRVLKRSGDGSFVQLVDVAGTTYQDYDVVGGTSYSYKVQASNVDHFSLETTPVTTIFTRIPGPVSDLQLELGLGHVLVSWGEPEEKGGHDIVQYNLTRVKAGGGTTFWPIQSNETTFIDNDVDHNQTYWYTIKAMNKGFEGWGNETRSEDQPIQGRLGAVTNLTAVIVKDTIELTWEEPLEQTFLEVHGYKVYRGEVRELKGEIMSLGQITKYVDHNVTDGLEYHYAVIAYHADLTGEWGANTSIVMKEVPEEPLPLDWLFIALLILALLVVIAVTFIVTRRRRTIAPEAEEEGVEGEQAETTVIPSAPWQEDITVDVVEPAVAAKAAPVVVAAPPADGLLPYLVEEVFVVYKDGRLITSCAREECGTPDADLMSGMLIAIQGLIQDGLESGGTLESIRYGENIINLATGDHVVVAAVVYGRPDEEFSVTLRSIAANIEGIYSGVVEDWTGEPAAMKGLDDLILPLIQRTEVMTREDVGDVLTAKGVAILSAVDFHAGYVRLKMAAVNATRETIIDSAIEVHYDQDMLRLERVEPPTITIRGDRVNLGNVKPSERKTVALLFDPQICQSTHIDGHLSYYDSKGELQYVEMKRRHADVVCPVFFTRQNANTAMLRRLMSEKLHLSDLRVYRYPSKLSPMEVLAIGRQALGSDDIQLVREYIVQSPTFEAEVWYYAETKVKGYQFVIRLGVVEDKGVLELFAASTAMEPITGLLADFRRELDRIIKERFEEEIRMELARDEQLRKDMEMRPLHLDLSKKDEEEGEEDPAMVVDEEVP